MRFEPIKPGDPLSAKVQNLVRDFLNRLDPEKPRQEVQIGLFLLSGALTYPGGAPTSSGEQGDETPYGTARQLWLSHANDDYAGMGDGFDVTLYHPLALRDPTTNDYIGLPTMREDQRVYAWFNPQAQRWEMVEQYLNPNYWGKLDGDLVAAGSATVSVYTGWAIADSGIDVTAYAPPVMLAGTLPSGEWVGIKWYPDYGHWYVVHAEC